MVGPDGYYRKNVPLFGGDEPKRVIDDKGHFGKLDDLRYGNAAVIAALKEAGALAAMNPRHKHDYAHSWRSKAPVIYRNTPQWFIAMDKPIGAEGLQAKGEPARAGASKPSAKARFVPAQGRNRIGGMVEQRPDWVISRQRAWGVPITVFVHKETGEVIPNAKFKGAKELQKRIFEAFKAEGADAWFAEGAAGRFLEGLVEKPADWEQVRDILDVWFELGLDACLLPGKAQGPEMARRRLSRRLGPASRLVPVLAAGKLRYARARALRYRADPRLRPRREGRGESRNRRATPSRRRTFASNPARTSCGFGRCPRTSRTTCATGRPCCKTPMELPQAPEYAALFARQPRALRAGAGGGAGGHAGAGALGSAPSDRNRRGGPATRIASSTSSAPTGPSRISARTTFPRSISTSARMRFIAKPIRA